MQVVETLTEDELQLRWRSMTEDEELANFEGRAELDAYGEIALTPPPSFVHQRIANELASQIQVQLGGRAIVECPVLVCVLITDAAWLSGDHSGKRRRWCAHAVEAVNDGNS